LLTDDEWIEMAKAHGVDATRLSTVISLGRAVERAAREAAIDECMKVCRKRAQRAGTLGRQFEAIDCAEDIRVLREES
jgi:hypothetical protein